jgi:photosystem II PsbZ protein
VAIPRIVAGQMRDKTLLPIYFQYTYREKKMLIVFQLALLALVVLSFVMVVGVPVGYATNQNWPLTKQLIFVGSIVWTALVIVVGVLNYFVV